MSAPPPSNPAPSAPARLPQRFVWALGIAACFMAFMAYDQSYWWNEKDDYAFGWLVPVFVAYVLYDRWEEIRRLLSVCAAEGSSRATGFSGLLLRLASVFSLLIGGLLFLMGSFYRSSAGPTPVGTITLTLGVAMVCAGLLALHLPEPVSTTPSPLSRDARLPLLALFVFPLAVWFISAPPVGVMEVALSRFLLHKVVTVVTWTFDTLGLTLKQQGSVLVLPTGRVGVEEACTGIRSLTGCIFAGAFLGAAWMHGLWRKLLLLVLGAVFAVVSNLARSLFLTGWAYLRGPEAIEGTVHDITGYSVLGLTTALLIAAAMVLTKTQRDR